MLCIATATLIGAVTSAPANAQDTSSGPLKITDAIPSTPISAPNQIFLDKTFKFDTPDGKGLIAGASDGTGDVGVDDEIDILVTRPDGTQQALIRNYEFQPPSAPIDLSPVLLPGTNTIKIGLRDTFGVAYGSTSLWLVHAAGEGQAQSPPRIVSSPDYKIVRYIKTFSVPSCVVSMAKERVPGGGVACTAIWLSRNPTPPSSAATAWTAFKESKEYRSLLHLPAYQASCDASGHMVDAPKAQSGPELSAGWTPIRIPGQPYVAGEKYRDQGGIWYNVQPVVNVSADRASAQLVFRIAARAGTAENAGSPSISGYVLPFIWTMIQVQLNCNGSAPTAISYSQIPSTVVFKDGVQEFSDTQTGDWGKFTKTGGRTSVVNGHGKLYTPCRTNFVDDGPRPSPLDCATLASGGAPFHG